jgi:GNAT superfamily N-acetyltransferase
MPDVSFRRAIAADADHLRSLMLDGIRHWGHDTNHPEAFAGLEQHAPDGEEVTGTPTWVAESGGRAIAFYSLREHDDHIELYQMFMETDRIGTGLGRVLWDHAVTEAARHSTRMRIDSDPMAIGFYEAMGARPDRRIEVAPGFELTQLWYDL